MANAFAFQKSQVEGDVVFTIRLAFATEAGEKCENVGDLSQTRSDSWKSELRLMLFQRTRSAN